MNVNLWNMTIACALRWGVASVGNILYWAWLTLYGKTFQAQGVHRWTTLFRGRNCEEEQHVAMINLFVKLWNNLVLVSNNYKRIVIELLWTVLNVISYIFNLNMDKWIPVNGT